MTSMGHRTFVFFNKYFMVPMFRLGFGPFMGNRITGYIMVLRTIGRKSGRIRYSPVNYAIHQGNIYCLVAFGPVCDWYRNLHVTREVEAMLPGGTIFGRVEEVDAPEVRKLILRKILKNAGFAGYFEGFNPHTITDEELLQRIGGRPLLCIHPIGLGSGPSDPGGWVHIWTGLSSLALIALIVFLLVR